MIETTEDLEEKIHGYIRRLESKDYSIEECRYTGSLDYLELYLYADWMMCDVDESVRVLVSELENMPDKEFSMVVKGVWILSPFYRNRPMKVLI